MAFGNAGPAWVSTAHRVGQDRGRDETQDGLGDGRVRSARTTQFWGVSRAQPGPSGAHSWPLWDGCRVGMGVSHPVPFRCPVDGQ
ncbi:hypothetical protein [Nitrosomonas sp. Nm33]|uniref:hypothetical protein n=1 Tax=Nitrosomonas sp. Nm33 TaxID=133724 RepID=UPI00115F8F3D|nr:hypothetical protein [Nitrosomonas sp. Nm33]